MKASINKYTVKKERIVTLAADITYYYAKRPYISKRTLCFSIYKYHKGLMYSIIKEYDQIEETNKIRLDENNYDILEFKSLLKAKELGWHISNETIFFKKNIINKNIETY